MIIKIFKTNQVIANIFIVLLAVLLFVPGYYTVGEINLGNHSLINFHINSRIFEVLFTSILVGVQGVLLNFIINQEKLIKGNTHLVGLFYVVINSVSTILFSFNPVIISNTFIILMLWLFFKLNSLSDAKSLLFNIGLLLGFCVLIYAPIICIFPLIWIILSYLRTPNFRDFFISLFGFFLPFIYLFAYLYLTDRIFNFNVFDWLNYSQIFSIQVIDKPFVYFLVVLSGFIALSLFSLFAQVGRDVIKDRKFFITILLLVLFLFSTSFLNRGDYTSLYILLTVPFSVFLANYFNKLKKEWLAEILFVVLVLGILASYFL